MPVERSVVIISTAIMFHLFAASDFLWKMVVLPYHATHHPISNIVQLNLICILLKFLHTLPWEAQSYCCLLVSGITLVLRI